VKTLKTPKTFDERSNGKKHIVENESVKFLTKELFRLSLPTMLGFAIQSLYDIVDMFWIGKISYKAKPLSIIRS